MSRSLRITIGQLNPTLGDLEGNCRKALEAVSNAAKRGTDLLVLPEMFISGYPLQDLVVRPAFVRDCMATVRRLAVESHHTGLAIAVGGPLAMDNRVFNALYVIENGMIRASVRKHHLPGTGVFDEPRTFERGGAPGPVALRGVRVGFAICEDFWKADIAETLAETGAELLVVANGSPYELDKYDERIQLMVMRSIETDLPVIYANLVGGQDDQVYDGGSFVLNRGGRLAAQAPFFEEALIQTDWNEQSGSWTCSKAELARVPGQEELDYHCVTLGLRDFARKNGFSSAVLGLSGGIDSALVAAIAVDALGSERVRAVLLPSKFTSEESVRCAQEVAGLLGCRLDEIGIERCVECVESSLGEVYGSTPQGAAGENVQARFRGLFLMAVANARGELLLATGNKSEIAVGYATLYGDMCGGYACLKDVYKTRVYVLARWRNANHLPWMRGPACQVIPDTVLKREPTAELRPNQRDRDSLPAYEELDAILELLVEQDLSAAEVEERGFDSATAERVASMLRNSEFKRYQSAPGPKLTRRAFWLERRYPVTNRYTERCIGKSEGS